MLSPGCAVAWPMEMGRDRRSPHHSIATLASMRRRRSRTEGRASSQASIQDHEELIIGLFVINAILGKPAANEIGLPESAFERTSHYPQ